MSAKLKPHVAVRVDYLRAAITALRYKARSEAGQSQTPDLFLAEETSDWAAAEQISHAIEQES